jgi:hypothetical protein
MAGVVATDVPTRPPKRPAEFTASLEMKIPKDIQGLLLSKYGIRMDETILNGWGWVPEEKRVFIPIRNKNGTKIGCSLRSFDTHAFAKNKVFIHDPDYPTMDVTVSFFDTKPVCLIMEDQLSKLKASRYARASVALLGTGMNVMKAKEIAGICAERNCKPVWALDPDAFNLAMRYRQEYNAILPNQKIVRLKRDVKDMSESEIKQLLAEI